MKQLKVTIELHLDVAEVDASKLIGQIEHATHGEFARRMWNIGDYIDFRVTKIEERVDTIEVFRKVTSDE